MTNIFVLEIPRSVALRSGYHIAVSIFDRVVHGKGAPQPHALFAIDKQCVHLLLQVALELRLGAQQLLVLRLGLLQLAVQRRHRVLNRAHLLHQAQVSVVAVEESRQR